MKLTRNEAKPQLLKKYGFLLQIKLNKNATTVTNLCQYH